MRVWLRNFGLTALISSSCGACAALYNIDAPTIGVIAKDELPTFQKAVRCELVTFIQANNERRSLFNIVSKTNRELAVAKYRYFDLDSTLFGTALIDLKVIDTVGLPSSGGTSINYRYQFSPPTGSVTNSQTILFGPSLTDQNTYEWQWIYLIPQNATLYGRLVDASAEADELPGSPDPFQCYRAIPETPSPDTKHSKHIADSEGLARGEYPQLEQFKRIRVNGAEPFAAWLQDNGSLLGTTTFATNQDAEKSEHIIPVQLYYNFVIQISGGLNASYSLLSPVLMPLSPVFTASQQQTNNLQIWLNGPDAALAAAARTGTAQAKNSVTPLPALPSGAPFVPYPCTASGCLLAPLPLNGPGPSPQQPRP